MKVAELFEGKEQNIAQLRKDYKNAMAWVNAPQNEVPNHERAKWERQAQKLRDHAKKQYKIDLSEEIKGWKHAGRDLAKHRAEKGKDVKLVRLKKDGTESKMNDATKMFRSEEEARRHHEQIVKLNPKSVIKHNLYIDGKPQLLESEVIKPEEEGWYVCDYKERPIHGPMSESKAKALADQLSTDSRPCTAEYYSDYQINRMNEAVAGHQEYMPSELQEASAPREDIPPYAVCHTSDGVVRKDDVYMGSKEDCLEYMRKHKAPKGMSFDLMHIDSGRLVSYKL